MHDQSGHDYSEFEYVRAGEMIMEQLCLLDMQEMHTYKCFCKVILDFSYQKVTVRVFFLPV